MSLAVFAVGLVLLAAPHAARRPLGRLAPAESARIAAVGLLGGAIAVELGLVMLALPAVLRSAGSAHIAQICVQVLTQMSPGGATLGWPAAVLAVAVAAAVAQAVFVAHVRMRAARVEPWLGRHAERGDVDVVVVPTPELLALSIPAHAPQVVLSDGLVEMLAPDELEAVIGHEVAHLRLGHRRYLVAASAVERSLCVLPFVRKSAWILRIELERWADVAAVTGSTRRADVHGALRTLASRERAESGFVSPSLLERLRGLDRAGPVRSLGARLATYPALAVLCLGGLMLVGAWIGSSHHVLALGGHCR